MNLTPKQEMVIATYADNPEMTFAEIGAMLCLSEHTIRFHIHNACNRNGITGYNRRYLCIIRYLQEQAS